MNRYPAFKGHKCLVMGLQGSGKTYYSKELIKNNQYTALVWTPHQHDFEDEPDNFIYYTPSRNPSQESFERFCELSIALGKKGEIDAVFIDEFDMLYKNNFEVGQHYTDLNANHRHYGLGLLGMTRRPQEIPTTTVESSLYTVFFCNASDNVKAKLNRIYKGWGDLVTDMQYKAYSMVLKTVGMSPIVFDRDGNQLEINKGGKEWNIVGEPAPLHKPDGSPIEKPEPIPPDQKYPNNQYEKQDDEKTKSDVQ